MTLMSPQVIERLNKFIEHENGVAMNIHHDETGRVLFVESLDERAGTINSFRRNELAGWVVEPCESFVEWAGAEPGGGTIYYSPNGVRS